MLRQKLFISYSRKDKFWMDEVQKQLAPLKFWHNIDIWEDSRLREGGHWRSEIKAAMDSARVAILIVSSNFLASEFISQEEIPRLLLATKANGVSIFIVIIDKCSFELSPLEPLQCIHDKAHPIKYLSEREQQTIFVNLAGLVKDVFEKKHEIDTKELPDYFYNVSLLLLLKQQSHTITELEKSTRFSRKKISNALYNLLDEGLVFQEKQKTKKPSTTWKASEYGKHVVDELEKITNTINV